MNNIKITKLFLLVLLFTSGVQNVKAQCKNEVLELLGAFSAMGIYNTYEVIGLIHDASQSDTYELTFEKEILNEQIILIGNVIEFSQIAVDSKGLNQTDSLFMTDAIHCCRLLIDEANALIHYLDYDTTEAEEKFQAIREDTWANIAALLGIDSTEE